VAVEAIPAKVTVQHLAVLRIIKDAVDQAQLAYLQLLEAQIGAAAEVVVAIQGEKILQEQAVPVLL
jgi:hypothetical protein